MGNLDIKIGNLYESRLFSATSPLKTYDIKQLPCDLHLARFSSFILLLPTCQYNKRKYANIISGDDMKPLKEKISITIDADLLLKLRQLAEEDDRSLSQYINLILKQHIDRKEKKGQ